MNTGISFFDCLLAFAYTVKPGTSNPDRTSFLQQKITDREVPFYAGLPKKYIAFFETLFLYYLLRTLCHFGNAFIDGDGIGHDQIVFFV